MAAEKPRSVDHVGLVLDDQIEELRVLFRRVFQVGILNHDNVAGDGGEAAPKRRALAGVRLPKQRELQLALQRVEDLRGPVARSVVDDNELEAKREGQHPADNRFNRGTLVVHGHHH